MSKRLIILGADGFSQTLENITGKPGKYDEIAFLDDNSDKAIDTYSNFGNYISDDMDFYLVFGNNEGRLVLSTEGAGLIPTIIHPRHISI